MREIINNHKFYDEREDIDIFFVFLVFYFFWSQGRKTPLNLFQFKSVSKKLWYIQLRYGGDSLPFQDNKLDEDQRKLPQAHHIQVWMRRSVPSIWKGLQVDKWA